MLRRLGLPALALLASLAGGTSTAYGGTGKALVSFGDSFASGQGQSDAAGTCARSPTKNYPALLAVPYGVQNDRADYTCAGATANGAGTNTLGNQVAQAQAAGTLGTNTVAVTITIGGNDNMAGATGTNPGSLYYALAQCGGGTQGNDALLKTTCSQRTDLLKATQVSAPTYQGWLQAKVNTIHGLAQNAKIVIVGYQAPISTQHPNGCSGPFTAWRYEPAEVSYLDNLQSVFAAAQATAASQLGSYVRFANLFSGSQGQTGSRDHDICGPSPWILSPIFDVSAPGFFQAKSLHPNDAGNQAAVTPIIAAYNS